MRSTAAPSFLRLKRLTVFLLACGALTLLPAGTSAAADKKTEEAAATQQDEGSGEGKPGAAPTEGTAAPTAPADTAPPPPIRNPPLRLEVKRNQPLAKQIEGLEGAEGNVVWLGEQKDPFLGLYIENYVGDTLGAVLILHDNEQHPDWPGMLRELRTSFPQHGWSTLSIALPDFRPIPPMLPPLPKPQPPAVPAPKEGEQKPDEKGTGEPADDKKTDDKKPDDANSGEKKTEDKKSEDKKPDDDKSDPKDADKKEEGIGSEGDASNADGAETPPTPAPAPPPAPVYLQRDSEIPVDQYPDEIDRRIKEATRYLIGEGVQHVLIVAFGNSAGLATHISRKMLINELDGLVLMDPKPYPEARFDLPTDTADLRIPVLDVVPEFESAANPLLRKQATARVKTPHYEMRMVRGAAVNFSGYEPYVFKAVRGWADTQFRNAPEKKDRKQQENRERAEKAATPVKPANSPETPAPQAPPLPKGGRGAPNLNEPIPAPIPG